MISERNTGTITIRWDRLATRVLLMLVIATMAIAVAQSFGPSNEKAITIPAWARPDSDAGGIRLFSLIAGSTLVSEDLTCIISGMMAGRGQLSLPFAILACAAGIFVGDVLLFSAGRWLVRPIVRDSNLSAQRRRWWKVDEESVARASSWLRERGAVVVFVSRFVPGTRLPLYTAAGVLDTPFPRFSLWLLVAVSAWTPLLVSIAALWGDAIDPAALGLRATLVTGSLALAFLLAIELRATSSKTKRLLLSKWRRITRWEFWPAWLFYIPVVLQVGLLAIRYRSLLCFTAANPAMPAGGFIGESKFEILQGLGSASEFVPRMRFITAAGDVDTRLAIVETFVRESEISFPIVIKPDAGQRGSGVVIARSLDECRRYLESFPGDAVAQEYVDGPELGVFYVRHPDEATGRIFAITDKRFLSLTGDGTRTLEELILADDRAVCMASFHLAQHASSLREIPAEGEVVPLVELGTHCRGALFLDGMALRTAELDEAIDRVSRSWEGFYFGRYDIRGRSLDEIRAGHFKVLELNGVSSEATSIYDPRNGLLDAYRVLFEQWRLAFEIGAANVRRGHHPATLRAVIGSLRSYPTLAKLHPDGARLRNGPARGTSSATEASSALPRPAFQSYTEAAPASQPPRTQ